MQGVSVIIPCYNAGKFIREAVASVHASAPETPYEIIIVDDGSTDAETSTALQEIAENDPKARVFSMSRNSGQSAARNYAIEIAKYDVIVPLDADDKMARTKSGAYIDLAYKTLSKTPDIVSVTSAYRQFGAVSGQCPALPYKPEFQLVKSLLPPFSAYRRAEAMAIEGYDVRKRFAEDWDFFTSLINKRFVAGQSMDVAVLSDMHIEYRTHATGLNSSVADRMPKAVALESIMNRSPEIYDHFYPGKTPRDLGSLASMLKVGFRMAASDPVGVCQLAASVIKRRVYGRMSANLDHH